MIISPVTPINVRLFGLFPHHENTARFRYQSGMGKKVLEVFFSERLYQSFNSRTASLT